MPLPSDPKLIQLANDIIHQFDTIFGMHPGYRPAHAKGVLLTGTFSPSSDALSLTRALHIHRESTPVSVRFSNATGIPMIPDNDANANPRGMAVRFHLADRVHTDIIAQSADGFPVRTGEEFLEFLQAVAASAPGMPSPTPVERFVGSHPATLAYVQMPKPSPSSFAREAFFGVTAMRFLNSAGVARYGRYRITPEAGVDHLDDAVAKAQEPNFLFDEIVRRVAAEPVRYRVLVQIADTHDVVNDATIHWPETRAAVQFGTITLNAVASDDAAQQKHMIFDPIPRVDGIEASDDPLLEVRAAVYLLSGRRRREAEVGRTSAR